jgi:hypothetical protein
MVVESTLFMVGSRCVGGACSHQLGMDAEMACRTGRCTAASSAVGAARFCGRLGRAFSFPVAVAEVMALPGEAAGFCIHADELRASRALLVPTAAMLEWREASAGCMLVQLRATVVQSCCLPVLVGLRLLDCVVDKPAAPSVVREAADMRTVDELAVCRLLIAAACSMSAGHGMCTALGSGAAWLCAELCCCGALPLHLGCAAAAGALRSEGGAAKAATDVPAACSSVAAVCAACWAAARAP